MRPMALNKSDLDAIKKLIQETVSGLQETVSNLVSKVISHDERFDQLKDELVDMRQDIRLLPTKDEFFTSMDKLMGKLTAIEEEKTVSAHQTRGHEDRITALEEIHPEGQHTQK